jgi:glutathione S-transferase
MRDLILHHYPMSPYSEKIRAILGYKGLAWRSVEIPIVAPKPDLAALTGGYRKTPVLQVGRDVILDTGLMVRVLERLYPSPALIPETQRMSCLAYAGYEQALFFGAVATVFQPEGLKAMIARLGPELMQSFSRDRQELFTGGSAKRPSPEMYKTHFLPAANAMNAQLAGQDFLLGEAPTLADFVCWHPIWFVRDNAGVAPLLQPLRNLMAWEQRMRALGYGYPSEVSAEAALETARASEGWLEFDGPLQEPNGLKVGERVVLRASDYGCEPVEGLLLHASAYELVLQRQDSRAGELRVHAPRAGFSLSAA